MANLKDLMVMGPARFLDKIYGNLEGNASTADKLKTVRSISLSGDLSGSASFDGSANITITATVADNSHNHHTLTGWSDTRDATTSPNDYNAKLKVVGIKTKAGSGITFDSAGGFATLLGIRGWGDNSGGQAHELAFDMSGELYHRYGQTTTWNSWKKIAYTDSSITGNASTATKLQTARTINGTSFNGSANITTSYWGTARDFTIGNTKKSVNGSGNVSWSIAEIGAVNKAGDTMTGALNFANNTWNTMGDDAYIGDYNQAGMIGIKGKNGNTGIYFAPYSGSTAQTITTNGSGTMTITGTVASTFSGYLSGNISGYASCIRNKFDVDTSNAKSIVNFYDSDNSTLHAMIGIHNTGGTYGAIYIIPYPKTEDPWNGNEGLYIAKNKLKLDSNIVPTTGNTSGTVGSSTRPVYVNAGVITATSYTAVGYGGTGTTTAPTQGGVIYASSTSAYASTAAGTSGQLLQSAGTGKPTWITATNSNTASTIVKRDGSGNFSAGTITASLSGNASSATKLATARNIALGGDFTGSASFNGTANATITATNYKCNVDGGNTNSFPYHRIAYITGKTGQYSDSDCILDIKHNYSGGGFGRIKISFRTNATGTGVYASATWLYRYKINEGAISIAYWGVTGNSCYADVFYNHGITYPRCTVYQAYGNRAWTLVSSNQPNDGAAATEAYTSISAAATALHGGTAYTATVSSAQSYAGVLPIAYGGTGATTKLNAKTNLGITYGTALPSSGSEGDIFFVLAS